MGQKNITLSIDEEICQKYKEYCKRNAIALSRSVEKFMKEQIEKERGRS